MLKPAIFALSLVLVAPMMAQAGEITLLPSVKLQIGDQDSGGRHWDGDRWRDQQWWKEHYQWRDNRWQPHGHDRHPEPRHIEERRPGPHDDRHR